MRTLAPFLILLAGLQTGWKSDVHPYLHAPAVNEYARHDPTGTTILPNGRFIHPAGISLPVARWPHGLALSPDGNTAFVASEGVGQLIIGWNTAKPIVREISPTVGESQQRSNAGGADFSPDGRILYWSSGETGSVYVFDVSDGAKIAEIPLNATFGAQMFEDSFAMDVKTSADGKYVYCADVTNFRMAVIDAAKRRVVGSVRVGRYPYALAVSGKRVYVANIGMFEYSAVLDPEDDHDKRGLSFPPFGVPSREAKEGVDAEGRHIPGLGDPNVPESFSVWGVDATDPSKPRVVAKIKTGLLVGAPAENGVTVGGSAPNFLAIHGANLYVSNGNNDSIQRIDLKTNRIAAKIKITPAAVTAKLRGVGPSGICLSSDGKRLYVAESGINAVGVLDALTLKALGHIPTAWYPYRTALSHDGRKLCCICFKGYGNGPSGGANRPRDEFMSMRGVFNVIPVPSVGELKAMTLKVLAYNGMVDKRTDLSKMSSPVVPNRPGTTSSQIKYVVFITKENHTYDTIFDHVPGANDDPSLLRWGYHQRITGKDQPTLENAAVMTNHNALARQFAISDNFYMEPEASGVGHRWLVGVQPNNFCQMTYTLGWNFSAKSTAPGRRASFGSNGSIAPEDYPEAGAMWEHLARNGVRFRNYGEGFEFAGVGEDEDEWKTGAREVVNIPMSKPLFDNTCREYPIFNMNIPDQYRADWFIKDFDRLFIHGRKKMPPFVNIAICNDHGTGPKPSRGYPYVASWMADNDLALGRMVEYLSHTPYWKNMAIFVTQDDAGGEADHVDAQRSVLLAISPWIKRGYVSHRHTTIPSMHRTLYKILGLPPLNMFDGLANDFSDCFTTKPDYRPYTRVPVDPRIFDPLKTKDPKDPDYKQARKLPSIRMDDPAEIERILQMEEQR